MILRGLCGALAFGLVLTSGLRAETRLTADDLRLLAHKAMRQGDAQVAARASSALLARDPGDVGALIIRSRAARALGQLPEAEALARQAFRLAPSAPLRYGAAVSLAQALSLQGHMTRSQLWLRRAMRHAVTPEDKARIASDYAYLRRQNPLSLRFSASVQPSDNVNNGSRHDVIAWDIGGITLPFLLSPEAKALAGTVADLSVSGAWRLKESPVMKRSLTFGLSHHEVWLRPESGSTLTGEDLRLTGVQIGIDQKMRLTSGGILGVALTGIHRWYGGADYSDELALDLDLARRGRGGFAQRSHMTLAQTWRQDANAAGATEMTLSEQRQITLPRDAGTLTFGVELGRTISDDRNQDGHAASLQAGWQAARDLGGVLFGGELGLGWRWNPDSPYATGGRHDRSLSVALTGEVASVSFYGFSPVVTLQADRVHSTADLFDTESLQLGFSVRSRF